MSLDVRTTPEDDRSVPTSSHYTECAQRLRDSIEAERAAAIAAPAPTFAAVYSAADLLRDRHCIYALLDPRRPGVVMYVGQTVGHVLVRYDSHLSEASGVRRANHCWGPRHDWIVELREKGLVPGIGVIETVPVGDSLDAAEDEWIRFYKFRGEASLNRKVRLAALHGFI